MTEEQGIEVWIKKSGGACSALAVIRQNGEVALFATQLGWLMAEELGIGVWIKKSGNGRWSLDNEKRR